MARIRRASRLIVTGIAVLAVTAVAASLYLFQPWKLWQDETVLESLPSAAAPTPAESASHAESAATPAAPSGPLTVAEGEFISHEHTTMGAVKVIRLPDGTRTLRLENLDTSNGPDLHVWLTDAPVKEGRPGWKVFDDGKYISLGKLKGNKGNQNYSIPADLELSQYTSVSVWCARFSVSFGAAKLAEV